MISGNLFLREVVKLPRVNETEIWMKILFAIKALDDVKGGAERVLADITSGLAEKGHHIAIMSFDAPGGNAFYPLNRKVHRIPLGIGNVTRKARVGEVFSRMVAIRRAAIRMRPDVVVAFMHSTFIPASFAMIGTGVPVIASEHIVPDHYKKRRWEYVLLLFSRFFVKKITVLSQSIINSYPPLLRRKMVPISNPVCPVKSLADTVAADSDRKVILNVGRLTDQKDQATLIESFQLLFEGYPEWDLHIIGDGELRETLEKQIQDYKLEGRVFLSAATPHISEEYQKAQIFCISSKYESFGLATAEAMAHGLPAIGFQSCPGTNEIINHEENGLLVDGGDKARSLAEGLKRLMDDENLRKALATNGIESVKVFHPDMVVKKWETIIAEQCKK